MDDCGQDICIKKQSTFRKIYNSEDLIDSDDVPHVGEAGAISLRILSFELFEFSSVLQ